MLLHPDLRVQSIESSIAHNSCLVRLTGCAIAMAVAVLVFPGTAQAQFVCGLSATARIRRPGKARPQRAPKPSHAVLA